MKLKLLLLLFILGCNIAYTQEKDIWTPPQKDSLLVMLDDMYNLEFDKFDQKLARYRQRFPERPEGRFAHVMAWWMKVTADIYNPKYDDIFETKLDSIIEDLERYKENDPLYPVAEFYSNSATGFKAIMHVTRENWWSAALEGRIAVRGIEQTLEGKIPNPDARFGTGLYLYYADQIPRRYPILKPLFLFYPDGDKERGLNDLLETTQNGVFAKVVASYMYAVILYTREDKHQQAYEIMHSLVERYPQNPTFLMWLASMATRVGKYSEAKKALDTYLKRTEAGMPYYPESKLVMAYFRYGSLLYKEGEFERALYFLDKAVAENSLAESSYMERFKVYAMLQRGYCLEKLSRLDDAQKAFESVLTLPEYHDSHQQAKQHIERIIKLQIRQEQRRSSTRN